MQLIEASTARAQYAKIQAMKDAIDSGADAADAADDDGACPTYLLIAILTSGHRYT